MSALLEEFARVPPETVELKKLQGNLSLRDCQLKSPVTYERLVRSAFAPETNASGLWNVRFVGPTTFNWAANKHYLPIPEPRLILESGINKWNHFARQHSLQDDDLCEQFLARLRVNSASIQTRQIRQSGHLIPCFLGNIRLYVTRDDPVSKLLAVVLRYLPYCGVGAKTAMGLGSVETEKLEDNA
jgi:CRISPR-associated endoribonuclease Cas6